jgi:hypothetical protein
MKQSLGLQSSIGLAWGWASLCIVDTMAWALNYDKKYRVLDLAFIWTIGVTIIWKRLSLYMDLAAELVAEL